MAALILSLHFCAGSRDRRDLSVFIYFNGTCSRTCGQEKLEIIQSTLHLQDQLYLQSHSRRHQLSNTTHILITHLSNKTLNIA